MRDEEDNDCTVHLHVGTLGVVLCIPSPTEDSDDGVLKHVAWTSIAPPRPSVSPVPQNDNPPARIAFDATSCLDGDPALSIARSFTLDGPAYVRGIPLCHCALLLRSGVLLA